MFLAKPLRFRADLVCARSLRGKAPFFGAALFCARLTLRVEPASEPRRAIPLCEPRRANCPRELPLRAPASEPALRFRPANPDERSRLANCPRESRWATLPRELPLRTPTSARHPCHQRIGPLSAPISIHRTSRFSLALGATKRSRSTLPASDSDKISPWCVPRRRSVAVFTSCVFKGASDGKRVPSWQSFAVARFRAASHGEISPVACSRTLGDGKMLAKCVSGRSTVARYRSDAFPKGPRTEKMPVRGKILPPCIQNELVLARFARYASENRRKAPFGNTPREDLAAKGPFRCAGPSNHAWRANPATL